MSLKVIPGYKKNVLDDLGDPTKQWMNTATLFGFKVVVPTSLPMGFGRAEMEKRINAVIDKVGVPHTPQDAQWVFDMAMGYRSTRPWVRWDAVKTRELKEVRHEADSNWSETGRKLERMIKAERGRRIAESIKTALANNLKGVFP